MVSAPGPVIDERSRVLILGTSSGWTSAVQNEYYAGHGNVFWRIFGEILGFSSDLPYDQRIAHLLKREIALWNVCSMPNYIGVFSPNDFAAFFEFHPRIERILFNGTMARKIYNRRVLPYLMFRWHGVSSEVPPSTSPLFHAVSFDEKLSRWRTALERGGRVIKTHKDSVTK